MDRVLAYIPSRSDLFCYFTLEDLRNAPVGAIYVVKNDRTDGGVLVFHLVLLKSAFVEIGVSEIVDALYGLICLRLAYVDASEPQYEIDKECVVVLYTYHLFGEADNDTVIQLLKALSVIFPVFAFEAIPAFQLLDPK